MRERLDQRPPRGDAPADRVPDVLRRATRALERQPRVTHAMVTAMSVSDDSAAPVKQEVNDTLRAIIVDAVDGTPVPDLDDVVRVLGSVWFAELTFWSGGLTDATAMADHLAGPPRSCWARSSPPRRFSWSAQVNASLAGPGHETFPSVGSRFRPIG